MSQNQNKEQAKAEAPKAENKEQAKAEAPNSSISAEQIQALIDQNKELAAKLEAKSAPVERQQRLATENERLAEQKEEVLRLKNAQNSGSVKEVEGNKDSSYRFAENEKDLIHLRCSSIITINNSLKNKESVKIAKFTPREFEAKEKRNGFVSFNGGVKILHDPRQAGEVKKHKETLKSLVEDKKSSVSAVIE
jgi:hypothetical protein